MKIIKLTSGRQSQIDGDEWFYPPSDKEGKIAYNHLSGELFFPYPPSCIKTIGLVFDHIDSGTIQPAITIILGYLTRTSRRYRFFRYRYIGYQVLLFASDFKKRIFIFEIVAKK